MLEPGLGLGEAESECFLGTECQWGRQKVLEVMAAQQCECPSRHWAVHSATGLKWYILSFVAQFTNIGQRESTRQ